MGSLLRNFILGTLLMPTLLVGDVAASLISVDTCLMTQELSVERSFQPAPPGVPERRLSGGTR